MKKNKTMQCYLYGDVQGVGMRYFIYRTAKKYGIKGYVRNITDGAVECLIQAKEDVLDLFFKHVKNESPGDIRNIEKNVIEDSVDYESFDITF